jgi:hypothetical protein
MRLSLLLFLLTGLALAQDAVIQTDLIGLAADAQRAIDAGDWKKAAALTSALKDATREARNRAWARATQDLEDRILSWLPEDTETIAAWQEPFTLAASADARRGGGAEAAQSYLLGLMNTAENGRIARALEGRTLRLSLLAARRFAGHPLRPDDSLPLGMIDYQGCAVYWFAEALPQSLPARAPDEVIEGHQVWTSRGSQHEAVRDGVVESLLLARPKPDMMIACSDREFLTGLLARMGAQGDAQRDAQGTDSQRMDLLRMGRPREPHFRMQALPAWKYVDRTRPLWAFRRFAPERAAIDPTQPANPSVLGKADTEAVALAVNMDSSGTIKALWISRSEADPWRTTLNAGAFERKAQSRSIATGLWELSVPGDQRVSAPAVFALMSCLGFAVLL